MRLSVRITPYPTASKITQAEILPYTQPLRDSVRPTTSRVVSLGLGGTQRVSSHSEAAAGPRPAPSLHLPSGLVLPSPDRNHSALAVSALNRPSSARPTPAHWALAGTPRTRRRGLWGYRVPAAWSTKPTKGWWTVFPSVSAGQPQPSRRWTTFPRVTGFLTRLHFRLFARFGGLAWGERCVCGGARAGSGGAREHEIGLDPGCRTPDPELHRLSRWAELLGGSVPGIAEPKGGKMAVTHLKAKSKHCLFQILCFSKIGIQKRIDHFF